MVEMKEVSSSNLLSVGYDASNRVLYVRFKQSGTYAYYDVPQSTYIGLMSAPSHGTYHADYIKYSFKYKKLN